MQIFPLPVIKLLSLQGVYAVPQAVGSREVQRAAACRAPGGHNGFHGPALGAQHGVAARLDDAGLGGGDLLQGVSQVLGVLQDRFE